MLGRRNLCFHFRHGDILKDCPIYIVVELDDGGKEELLFVVIIESACVYTNDKQEETFATIIHCDKTLLFRGRDSL